MSPFDLPPKVARRIRINNVGCWVWTGCRSQRGGYGRFAMGPRPSKQHFAHRFAYEVLIGPVAAELDIDHLCRVTSCCNPDHLEAVSHEENVRRHFRLQSRCRHGHPYTPENTLIDQGRRRCRICRRQLNLRASAKRYGKVVEAGVA